MNKLTKRILMVLGIIISFIISLQFNLWGVPKPTNINFILILISRVLPIVILLFYMLDIGLDLCDLINIKYRIIKDPKYTNIYIADYLTLNALFIPEWKAVKYKTHTYESQNIFGATFTNMYETDQFFTSENDAIKEIEIHRAKCERNRQKWIVKKSKEKAIIKYL